MVDECANSRVRKLACPPCGHHVAVALPCVLGGLGMSSGLGTPHVGARKKMHMCLIYGTGNAHG